MPSPHEGESHLDEQSETTSAPVPEKDPPVRTPAAPTVAWGLWALWTAVGIALVVLLVMYLV